ncbi:MAG: dihydrofolate reductase family protein, partial [Methanosarcina sp.]|nr:dihydrofolate reductase family protein [Methanosarcina sp.]
GGSQIIKVFLEEDLVQDLIIFVVPVILGSGIPLFDQIQKEIGLKLINTERYESGLVRVEYEI